MKIAIDWDDTYTADPALFNAIISLMIERGHVVYCVTARRGSPADKREVRIPNVPTFFTGYASKTWHMNNIEGIKVDIWIDDNPAMCAFGSDEVKPATIKLAKRWQMRRKRRR